MKKLLGIAVLGLLLSGNAYSKIIDLHCKFIAGNIVEKVPHPGHEDIKKNTTYISISEHDVEGYNIKLDTTNKKIIEAPMFESDGSTRMFGDNLIFWYYQYQLLNKLGFKPDFSQKDQANTPLPNPYGSINSKTIFDCFENSNSGFSENLSLSSNDRKIISNYLNTCLKIHFEGIDNFKTLKFMKETLS